MENGSRAKTKDWQYVEYAYVRRRRDYRRWSIKWGGWRFRRQIVQNSFSRSRRSSFILFHKRPFSTSSFPTLWFGTFNLRSRPATARVDSSIDRSRFKSKASSTSQRLRSRFYCPFSLFLPFYSSRSRTFTEYDQCRSFPTRICSIEILDFPRFPSECLERHQLSSSRQRSSKI